MRKHCFRLLVGILALLTPASGSAIELAHGVVHGEIDAIAHTGVHDLDLALDAAPSDMDHGSLHAASFPARLSRVAP